MRCPLNLFDETYSSSIAAHTLDSVGQLSKSTLTVTLLYEGIELDVIKEFPKQLTPIFVRLVEQPNFNFPLNFDDQNYLPNQL